MALPVIVKSTKKGIHLILSEELEFQELLEKIREKFDSSKDFFQNADFSVSFGGRNLTEQEQCEIINVITESCNANIVCILEENELQDAYIEQRMQQIADEKLMKNGQFHKGDIQTGETLECETSVIILGSILDGGKVISKGNIVVIGSLEGYAFAGASGKENAFICALEINSDQLRISDAALKNTKVSFGGFRKRKAKGPQIAIAKDKAISIEPLTTGYLNSI